MRVEQSVIESRYEISLSVYIQATKRLRNSRLPDSMPLVQDRRDGISLEMNVDAPIIGA